MNAFRVDGKLALVTGGSRGIGLGIARELALAGADVILASRGEQELSAAAASLSDTGRKTVWSVCDLLQPATVSSWYDELVAQRGRPNILVNAAGMTRRGPTVDLPLADWEATLTVNLTSMFVMSQAFARHLIAANEPGKIVNIASLATHAARPTIAAYTASKGGVGQLTKALAVEWAKHGILVNAIGPGYIDTALTASLVDDPEFTKWVTGRCPLGRWGTAEDVARPAVFLASAASDFVTGQILYVDGGWQAAL